MPDIADDRAAFREAMARAEAASGIERDADGNETNGIEAILSGKTSDANELKGAVPVAASEQPLVSGETAPVVDTSSEEQAATPPQTVEELIAEREKLIAQVEEQKLMIGRQSTEVGESRERMAVIEAELAGIRAAQAVEPAAPAIQITPELIETNPALAAQAAFEQKNQSVLEAAWNAWDAEGDGSAKLWLAERRAEQREAELRAEIAATREKIEQIEAPLAKQTAEATEQAQWREAFDTVREKHPDVFQPDADGKSIAESLILAAGTKPEYGAFREMLQTGDGPTKAAALSALYALERIGDPQGIATQLAEAAREAEVEAAAARVAAGAVTGQTTSGQPGEQKTEEEQEQEGYIRRQKDKPSLAKGWTGRS